MSETMLLHPVAYRRNDDGSLDVCCGAHASGTACQWEEFAPAPPVSPSVGVEVVRVAAPLPSPESST